MVVNQHHIRDPKFENKYPLKLKILSPLLVLKKKLENGNLRIASVDFAKFTYPIWILFKVYSKIPFSEDSYHIEISQLIYISNQINLLVSMWCGILLKGVSERSIGLRKYLYFYFYLQTFIFKLVFLGR